jgi:hypothetical protein
LYFPKFHNLYNDEGDVGISTIVVPADMNKPYLLVLDRTALTKQSLASLVSAFSGKPLVTADLSSSMEHRIVVPPRRRKPANYCVSITTERFPISWHELSTRAKRKEVSSVVLEPVEKARLVSLPGRDVPIESVQPQADEPPPQPPSGHPAFVESPAGNTRVSCGRAGAAGRSEPPRITKDGSTLSYPAQYAPSKEMKERVMFVGDHDEPSRTLNLGRMSDCWKNLDPSSRK